MSRSAHVVGVIPLIVALGLVGCTAAPEAAPPTVASSSPAPAGNEPAAQPVRQPTAGATGVDAASQMLTIRWELMAAGDWAGACSLLSAGSVEDLIAVAAPDAADCPSALAAAAEVVAEALATAEAEAYLPLVPYYYVPTSIMIDASALEEDSPTLVYSGVGAVTSTDLREFDEGVGALPGWLAESTYLQQDAAGVWRFITAAERE